MRIDGHAGLQNLDGKLRRRRIQRAEDANKNKSYGTNARAVGLRTVVAGVW